MVGRFSRRQPGTVGKPRAHSLRVKVSGLACAAVIATSGPAASCAFDMVKPERNAIDRIVQAERLVSARPAPENQFAFYVTDVFVGTDKGPPIDQLVDTTLRRKLAADPEASVLFAHDADRGWQRVAYLDQSFDGILRTALAHRTAWDEAMPQSRLDFIEALQDGTDPAHRALVISELDNVPYDALRRLDLRIPDTALTAELWTPAGYPYQAIRALLLGLSGTPAARSEIHGYIHRAEDQGPSANLGAFAAAFIELEGVAGVERLARGILTGTGQPAEKLEQIVMALSVHHGQGDPSLQKSIRAAIADLIDKRPEAGAIVARQFSLRSDWSQSDLLEPLVRERKLANMRDLLTVSVYVAKSREMIAPTDGVQYE